MEQHEDTGTTKNLVLYRIKTARADIRSAQILFEAGAYIEMYDFEHSNEEDRYIAIGRVEDILFVVFTERKENIRLISARLATEIESAKKCPIVFDEDTPELSPAMYKAFKSAVIQRNRKRNA